MLPGYCAFVMFITDLLGIKMQKVYPINQPDLTFLLWQVFPFKEFLFTSQLKTFLWWKHWVCWIKSGRSGVLLAGFAIHVSFITLCLCKREFQVWDKGPMNGCCLEHNLFVSTGLLVCIIRLIRFPRFSCAHCPFDVRVTWNNVVIGV